MNGEEILTRSNRNINALQRLEYKIMGSTHAVGRKRVENINLYRLHLQSHNNLLGNYRDALSLQERDTTPPTSA